MTASSLGLRRWLCLHRQRRCCWQQQRMLLPSTSRSPCPCPAAVAAAPRGLRGAAMSSSSTTTIPDGAAVPPPRKPEEFDCSGSVVDDRILVDNFRPFYERRVPVILKGFATNRYPAAMEKWNDLDYLVKAVGTDAHCDVESKGGAYNAGNGGDDDGGTRLTIPFESYVDYLLLWEDKFGSGSASEMCPTDQLLYLAQNELQNFGQTLVDDVSPPPAVCTTPTDYGMMGHLYHTMLWMGPRGCVSPLHYDPLDNILVQICGRKRVTMIANDVDPNCLYAGAEHGQQSNTSAVNVEEPDLAIRKYPLYGRLLELHGEREEKLQRGGETATEDDDIEPPPTTPVIAAAELLPGDALFIPAKWWHHVRSLDLTVSVNFWWR